MKRLLMTAPVVALVVLLVCTEDASAFGRRRQCNEPCPPPCAPAVNWVEQVVTCFRMEWRTRQVRVSFLVTRL
jgi:hypothetical protein